MPDNNGTSNRGFASMDEDKQREIASKGGQSVPDEKRTFSQDRELAAEAGRKGGESSGGGNRGGGNDGNGNSNGGNSSGSSGDNQRGGQGNFAQDRERAAEAGRKGGEASQGGR